MVHHPHPFASSDVEKRWRYVSRRRSKRTTVAGLAALLLAGCASNATQAPVTQPVSPTRPAAPPKGMQWLYGSGESAATSIQAFRAFRDYTLAAIKARPRDSVVLADGATLAAPRWVPCGNRPFAVVLDVDETVIQNLGYEYDEAITGRSFDSARWQRWERTGADKVAPIPGAVTALRALRQAGVAVIYNTNRESVHAAQTADALNRNGLGPVKHRETLWLAGDVGEGSAKDGRRAVISERYCVVAMAGDQLGDFSDLFNAKTLGVRERREAAGRGDYAPMWGAGWFMFANPVYGPSIRGDFDEVFPVDKQWRDPGE
jgi:5'-nucleotidase (lipoprotein e(P4) family)